MNAQVLETLKRSAAVPSMPQVVLRFLEIMQDPDFDYADLVKVLSADAGTVSEVLRLANSALFGVRHKVVSTHQALTLLGPKRMRSLLLGRYLVDSMTEKQVAGLDMSYFWRRSLISSVVASNFAEFVLPQRQDEAFIGALLSKIGIPILAEALPKSYGPIVRQFAPHGTPISSDDELAAVEVTHSEVSAMVLSHWTLPENVVNAVNLHQSQNPGEGDVPTVARIINSADRIGRIFCQVAETDDDIARTCIEAAHFIEVAPNLLIQLLPTIESDIEELADALRIDVIAGSVYALVAKAVQDKLAVPTS